jgi:hypothetical protein
MRKREKSQGEKDEEKERKEGVGKRTCEKGAECTQSTTGRDGKG